MHARTHTHTYADRHSCTISFPLDPQSSFKVVRVAVAVQSTQAARSDVLAKSDTFQKVKQNFLIYFNIFNISISE